MNRFSVDKLNLVLSNDKPGYFWCDTFFDYTTHVNQPTMDFPVVELDAEGNRLPPKAVVRPYVKNDSIVPYRRLYIGLFYTDLGTFPWWIGWRIKKLDKHNLATVVHDYMLQHREEFPEFNRKDIDRIFREALKDLGVPDYECKLLYAGVRIHSWWVEERFL